MKNRNTIKTTTGPGEANEGEVPQVSKSYSDEFLAVSRIWVKVATAQSTLRFLDEAQKLGINTNDVQNFLSNQSNLQKVKTNAKYNLTLSNKHKSIATDLMYLKVSDQSLVLQQVEEAAARAR